MTQVHMKLISRTIMGFVASSSIEPKYAVPPASPASTHGMVNA